MMASGEAVVPVRMEATEISGIYRGVIPAEHMTGPSVAFNPVTPESEEAPGLEPAGHLKAMDHWRLVEVRGTPTLKPKPAGSPAGESREARRERIRAAFDAAFGPDPKPEPSVVISPELEAAGKRVRAAIAATAEAEGPKPKTWRDQPPLL